MPESKLNIPGEAAIVTGSATGIGYHIAHQLATAGVNVALNDIDSEELADAASDFEGAEGDVITIAGDISESGTPPELVSASLDAFDRLDILVNNVGIAGPTKPASEITTAEFMDTLSVNLGGMHATTVEAIPHLPTGGRIVNLASISGKQPLEYRTPYTTSKMGVIGYTRTLAVELAERGITVNAICPGSVEGSRLDAVMEGQARERSVPVTEIEAEFRAKSPMNAFVRPEDIADAVLFLCSTRAARMTGQDLNVTAGKVMH